MPTIARPSTLVRSLAAGAAIAALLCACNAKDPSQPKPPTPQAETEQATGVIPQSQLDAMKKAKDVEKVLQQGAQRSDASE
jgi:hypothetical protein